MRKVISGMIALLVFIAAPCALGAKMPESDGDAPAAQKKQSEFDRTGRWGLGIGTTPVASGISAKYVTTADISFEFAVGTFAPHPVPGWTDPSYGYDSIGADVAMLHEMPVIAESEGAHLAWNYGLAGGIGVAETGASVIGGMGVLGGELNLEVVPVDFVVEYRPGLFIGNFGPESGLEINFIDFAGHIRYYF